MPAFEYCGYSMRSHSETRWASMMDCMGVRWLYEWKTFKTGFGGYLPDFYLPDAGCFLEVKGPRPNKEEIGKAHDVEKSTGIPVVFAHGSPKMDGMFLGSAFITWSNVSISIYEISEGICNMYGSKKVLEFASAGKIGRRPDYVSASDLMQDYLDALNGRNAFEERRKAIHKPLNDMKLSQNTVPTYSSALIGACVDRIVKRRMK